MNVTGGLMFPPQPSVCRLLQSPPVSHMDILAGLGSGMGDTFLLLPSGKLYFGVWSFSYNSLFPDMFGTMGFAGDLLPVSVGFSSLLLPCGWSPVSVLWACLQHLPLCALFHPSPSPRPCQTEYLPSDSSCRVIRSMASWVCGMWGHF